MGVSQTFCYIPTQQTKAFTLPILTRHFYDMSNMMSRNEDVWLSNGWVKTLLWIFLPCFLYTVISIVYFVASYIDK